MPPQFDAFTARARRVLSLAEEEARRFDHDFVGPEHLLLGLARERDGIAGHALADLDISLPRLRAAVAATIGFGAATPGTAPRMTPPAHQVIELAMGEARQLEHPFIGTEHLLLGLIRESEGMPGGVLDRLGVSRGRLREQVIQILGETDRQRAPIPELVERVRRGVGRPPLHGARMRSLRVNVPSDLAETLASHAQQRHSSQSEIVRCALERWLRDEATI